MSLIRQVLFRSADSAETAKARLQLILAQDRSNISAEMMEILKDEIISVISRYIKIDRANVEVLITRSAQGNRLVANIPVMGTRGEAHKSPSAGQARKTR